MSRRFRATALLVILMSTSPSFVDGRPQPKRSKKERPAEETRLSSSVFRTGLRKRGLTELLDLHLIDFPPAGKIAALLMRRDLRLSEYADPSRTVNERRDAIAAANNLLEEAILEAPEDKRNRQWRFDLAHSLVYNEAEPFFSSILYRGGNNRDRKRLLRITNRAIDIVDELVTQLQEEYAGIDNLSLGEFEKLERSGHIEMLDSLTPRAEYLQLWALFYNALAREDSPKRSDRLQQVLAYLDENGSLLTASHAESKVQVQVYLLLGMTHRLLNDHPRAREALARSATIYGRIESSHDREAAKWAGLLGRIEIARNDFEAGRFQESVKGIDSLRRFVEQECHGEFAYELLVALLEREIYKSAASQEGISQNAKNRNLQLAWQSLYNLRLRFPLQRDELNATLFSLIEAQNRFSQLDPVETAAVVAGLLTDNQGDNKTNRDTLQHVVDIGTSFVNNPPESTGDVIPEMTYNVAVAHFRRSEHGSAAQWFLRVAKKHPTFSAAQQASVFAVELAYSFYDQEGNDVAHDVQLLYLDALETLLGQYSQSQDAAYWRFYYAQLLFELGRYEEAEPQFGKVDRDHKQYLRGALLRLRCLANSLQSIDSNEGKILAVNQRINQFRDLRLAYSQTLTEELTKSPTDERENLLMSLSARALLLDAEVSALGIVNKPDAALVTLSKFEDKFSRFKNLSGRVWKVRLVAYEKLGRIDDAATAIPAFIAADPDNAGPTLQSLYLSLTAEFSSTPFPRMEGERATLAVLLAEQVYDWSQRTQSSVEEQQLLRLQLAEANLYAGRLERAKELFEACGASAAVPDKGASIKPQLEMGYAETLYRMDDHGGALLKYNRLATGLPADDPMRIGCLLRDLQCRTVLKQSPEGVIQVIKQQKYLHPEIAQSPLADEFDRLLRENQRRAAQP